MLAKGNVMISWATAYYWRNGHEFHGIVGGGGGGGGWVGGKESPHSLSPRYIAHTKINREGRPIILKAVVIKVTGGGNINLFIRQGGMYCLLLWRHWMNITYFPYWKVQYFLQCFFFHESNPPGLLLTGKVGIRSFDKIFKKVQPWSNRSHLSFKKIDRDRIDHVDLLTPRCMSQLEVGLCAVSSCAE